MVNFIIALLTGLDVLIAFCMIILILMQQAKGGGGLGAIGGGDTSGSIFGAGSGNVLTKTTTILAACFLAITLALAVITGNRTEGRSVVESKAYDVQETADDAETTPEDGGVTAGETDASGNQNDASPEDDTDALENAEQTDPGTGDAADTADRETTE